MHRRARELLYPRIERFAVLPEAFNAAHTLRFVEPALPEQKAHGVDAVDQRRRWRNWFLENQPQPSRNFLPALSASELSHGNIVRRILLAVDVAFRAEHPDEMREAFAGRFIGVDNP